MAQDPVSDPPEPQGRRPAPLRERRSAIQGMVGASPRMQRIFRLVSKVAPTDSTVLITGESGTGKELVARALHLQSQRADGPFVPVNVGAIPDTLIESELFGAARGAYTGAGADRQGLVEEADRGTLFLDEIGDMPPAAQVKLLRVLENSEVRRLGDKTTRLVDVRVIAATHRDLSAEIAAGRFRQDLYYRLNVVQIHLPPLRERREDIGLLASYFLERVARRAGRSGVRFSPEAMALLESYDYPGNVRELENAVEHAVAVAEGPVLQAVDLPTSVRAPRLLPTHEAAGLDGARPPVERSVAGREAEMAVPARAEVTRDSTVPVDRTAMSLADVEREHIIAVLERHRGNATASAKQLGISRTTLWRKMRAYGIGRRRGDAR